MRCIVSSPLPPSALTSRLSQNFSSSTLKSAFTVAAAAKKEELRRLTRDHGDSVVGSYTVSQIIGGMRGIRGMFYDQSTVDASSGVLFRGHSIPSIQSLLPKSKDNSSMQPLPEGMFYLLLTGSIPTSSQVEELRCDWSSRASTSSPLLLQVEAFIASLDSSLHPMTILSLAILYLQRSSSFLNLPLHASTKNQVIIDATFEDSMNILAYLPRIVGAIYRKRQTSSPSTPSPASHLDWSASLSHHMFHGNPNLLPRTSECFRGFLTVHSDHEGGEVSTHAAHIASSALCDPYLAISNGISGLAGPLHGLANQEVLKFVLSILQTHGPNPSDQAIAAIIDQTIANGKVIPGYGHTVLRCTDPRFTHLKDLATVYFPSSDLVALLHRLSTTIPSVLSSYKKISSIHPNVDAASGTLLYELGIKDVRFYTVLFAMARSLGSLSNILWARALALPIESMQSLDLQRIKELFGDQ